MKIPLFIFLWVGLTSAAAFCGEAEVVNVKITQTGTDTYRFDVTVQHGDQGWDHYADKWDIVSPDGRLLGTRVLHHPHVEEQPFTRSLSGVNIPQNIKSVRLRAHDSVHGYRGKEITVLLP